MKKRITAIFLSLLMAASSIPAYALDIEAPEQASEAEAAAPAASLQGLAEDDAASYQPADADGNLIGFISFDGGSATRDAVSWAPALPEFYSNGLSTYSYVSDPLGQRSGLVLKQDAAATLYRSTLALFDSNGTDGLELGKYVMSFDVYTSSDTARDDFFRFDLGSKSWSLNDEVYNNRGKWHTVRLEFEVTEVGETATIVSGGTTYTGIALQDVMQIWYNKSVASTTYYDNMALYFFPKDTAAFIDQFGNRTLADVSAMTAFPTVTDVISYGDDDSFAGWKDENGTLYTAGTAVTAEVLKYHTFTGVAKASTGFVFGSETGSVSGITYIPFPSEVDADWSDEGFYAWYDDYDGSYYFPGEAADMEYLDGAELAAVNVADFNAELGDIKIDPAHGIVITGTDFEGYDIGTAAPYGINAFDTLPYHPGFAKGATYSYFALGTGVEVVNDPSGTHGKVLKNNAFYEASVHYMSLGITDFHAGPGTAYVASDEYSADYTAFRIDWGSEGAMSTVGTNTWNTISRTVRYNDGVRGNIGGQLPFALNSIAADIYYDNVIFCYMPDGAVFFKNDDGTYAVYYAGADGNVKIPAPSAVNADWSDTGFGGWTSTSGTHYGVGDTVAASALAGQILENVIVSATFVNGSASANKGGLDTIPYPSEVDEAWSDAGFYAWTDGTSTYFAGEAFTTAMSGKTFTKIDVASVNAAAGDYTVDAVKGILITGTDFESYDIGTAAPYGINPFDTLPFNAAFANGATLSYFALGDGVEIVADPVSGGTHGKVLYNKPFYAESVQYMSINAAGFGAGAGTLTAEADAYSPNYNAFRIDVAGSVGDTLWLDTGKWNTITRTVRLDGGFKGDLGGQVPYALNSLVAPIYYDNINLWYKPDGAVFFKNDDGTYAMYFAGADGNITIPAPSALNADWSDDGFGSWTSTNGSHYGVGDTVSAAALSGQILENVVVSATFMNGASMANKGGFEDIPYPSEVNDAWSDAGFYAWTDGTTYYFAGEAFTAEHNGKTFTKVDVASINAAAGDYTVDMNKGILITGTDFEKYDIGTAAPYGINQFDTLPYNAAFADGATLQYFALGAGVEVVNDPKGTHGKVLYNKPFYEASVQYMTINASGFRAGAGTLTAEGDACSPGYNAFRIDINGNAGGTVWVDADKWNTISRTIRYDAGVKGNLGGQVPYALINTVSDIYYDNINLWYKPDGVVYFKNADGKYAIFFAGADGNITVPAPSALNADWSDTGFGGWTSTNGTHYDVGATVSAATLSGQVLEDKVVAVNFNNGIETEAVNSIAVIPYPSEIKSTWSDAGFAAWNDGTNTYLAGDVVSIEDLDGKTLTLVTAAAYNAAMPEATIDGKYGYLVGSTGFETVTGSITWNATAYDYVNTGFIDTLTFFGVTAQSAVLDDPTNEGYGKVAREAGDAMGYRFMLGGTNPKIIHGSYTLKADVYSTQPDIIFDFRDVNDYQQNHFISLTVPTNEWSTQAVTVECASFPNYNSSIWGNGTGTLYIDNLEWYYRPANSVVFELNGKQSMYLAGADGNIVIPAPEGVNANWTAVGFIGWQGENGEFYEVGDTASAADLANVKLVAVTSAPITLNKASIRLSEVSGLRFGSFISNIARTSSTEYGYIVALKDSFEDVDYDYVTNLVLPDGYDTAAGKGTLDCGGKFINGICYDPAAGIDLIYATDGEVFGSDVTYTDGVYFTGVLTGMSTYEQYHADYVARPYVKIGGTYLYGAPIVRNIYDIAVKWQVKNGVGANDFIDTVVAAE